MERLELTAALGDSGRLDAWLAGQCPTLSRSALQNLIEQGLVTCGGAPVNKKDKVAPGKVYAIDLPDPQPIEARPQNIPLDIVYEDDDLLVVNKPKGMVVHPAPGNPDGTLVNALLYHCAGQLSGIGGSQVCLHGLAGAGTLRQFHLHCVQIKDRAHPSDSCTHGLDGASVGRGCCVRPQKLHQIAEWPVPARQGAGLCPPADRGVDAV